MSDPQGKIPMGGKLGIAAAGGVGLIGLIYRFREEASILVILLMGIVFVGMLLAGYTYYVQWREGKKGKVFEKGLGDGAGSRPAQVTASQQRVLLDDLRKKFQEGLKVFESTGKSVYRLPWYLVVGESGSGKSRMIERNGVPGPSRLKDPIEGSGGTINMNWWFRNEAVLLDTAGRLIMPEVATAESPEWDNFLKLLNSYRPNCPVNGLFLVIPADTLVTDTKEELDAKSRQIAQQFDRVQTVMGIRFPVYVVITKCDKINGFRQFFESMLNPDDQSQMLGWSNPAKLDEPFRPDLVEEHLRRYPLAPQGKGNELKPEDMRAAAALINLVRGTTGPDPKSIAMSPAPQDVSQGLREAVGFLVGDAHLEKETSIWLNRAQKFAKAYQAGRGFTCTVNIVNPAKLTPAAEAMLTKLQGYHYLRLDIDGQAGEFVFVSEKEPKSMSQAKCAVFSDKGKGIILYTVEDTVAMKPAKISEYAGVWSAVKLMDAIDGAKSTDNGKTWSGDLKFTPKGANADLSVPVSIEFSQEIDWPSIVVK